MRFSIFSKLFISILLVCIVMLGSMTLMINTSFRYGLQQYVNDKELLQIEELAEKASAYYSERFGWQRLVNAPHIWAGLMSNMGEMPPPMIHRERGGPGSPPPPEPIDRMNQAEPDTALLPLSVRTNLLDKQGRSLLGIPENMAVTIVNRKLAKVPIEREGTVIGYVSIVQSTELSGKLAESFFQQQSQNFFVIAAGTILFSLFIALVLVRHFLRPLSALTQGAKSIAKGDLDIRLAPKGDDELAALMHTFNEVAVSLQQQKCLREQWMSDISHELRTPLAVLRGELEALQDGIRSPEPAYINSLHAQALTLGKLVDDLHALSLSESGMAIGPDADLDLVTVLNEVIYHSKVRLAQKEIDVELQLNGCNLLPLHANKKALSQLFSNLFENSYRYTDSGGMVKVELWHAGNQAQLVFSDSAPGVPDDALPRLFDRLYRVDKSRSRASGGSGLGLAICQNIVQAHGGTVSAEHSPLGGLSVKICLPVATEKNNE